MVDVAIVGGGIVGLAVAWQLTEQLPGISVVVLEKEPELARHQSGRNSGVIHSGLYYRPGSRKALLTVKASRSLLAFCREQGIRFDLCGKLVVATGGREVARLDDLEARARANGIPLRRLSGEEAAELEPHVTCAAALHVPSAGVVDFREVALAYAALARRAGTEVQVGSAVVGATATSAGWRLRTTHGELPARFVVGCAGLHSDELARSMGARPDLRIIPFRGEYRELVEDRAHLVRALVYPVPDPSLPFLGVHLTRDVHGSVHAGPNAVVALAREGYSGRDISVREVGRLLGDPATWRLARRHWRTGVDETARSLSKARFLRAVRRLVPEITARDLRPAPAGVRAQAVDRRGGLVDDFAFATGHRSLHVLNAPSPAATASLEIGRLVASRAAQDLRG